MMQVAKPGGTKRLEEEEVGTQENECPQMTPQERKQYEWYMKKYQNADKTRDPRQRAREDLHDYCRTVSSLQPYAARAH